MKLTGAAILVSRGTRVLQAAPAAYPYRSAQRTVAIRFDDMEEMAMRYWKELQLPREPAQTTADRPWREHYRTLKSKPPSKKQSGTDILRPQRYVYCVEVCRFTFRFVTLREMARYRDYFAAEHLPSQRLPNPRVAKCTGDRRRTVQTTLSRLPMRLKTKVRRAKIVKALDAAMQHFALEG